VAADEQVMRAALDLQWPSRPRISGGQAAGGRPSGAVAGTGGGEPRELESEVAVVISPGQI